MHAVRVHEFGDPEVLRFEEVPDPTAGPGQVVVGVAVADVLFLDTLLRNGWGQETFPVDLPYVPGTGGAGKVLSVGSGVDPGWVGRRVVARTSSGYAEQIVAGVEELVEIPDNLDFTRAAALMHDGATALGLIDDAGGIDPHEWVLIAAASGGAGTLLVQLAHDAGARVIAAARGQRKLDLARTRGAAVTIDYSTDDWEQQVRAATGGAGATLTFDGAGGELGTRAFEATAEGGRFITYGTSDGFTEIDPQVSERRRIRVHNPLLAGPPDESTAHAGLTRTLALAAEGKLRPMVGATYSLEHAAEAHAALAQRATLGKSLLVI